MKLEVIFLLSMTLAIYASDSVLRKTNDGLQVKDSDKTHRNVHMPPKSIQFVITPKPTQQPLVSLYKAYVGKKPLMRKFVPTGARITEPPIEVTRRPIMKQRHLVVGSTTAKPQTKLDLHVTIRRRVNFRPNKTSNQPNEDKRQTSDGKVAKSRIAAVVDDNDYDNLRIVPSDLLFAKSQKVYTIVDPPNSNPKDANINSKNHFNEEKSALLDLNNEKLKPDTETNTVHLNNEHQSDHNGEKQDRKEFIFVNPKDPQNTKDNSVQKTEDMKESIMKS
ncbi:unnamed protein product [Leptosia nina]|uniref:Uncharacterized protein n=1 Tax=Leptosia nina TaxID=320188 RepID=A0AAV1J269_9NEOP